MIISHVLQLKREHSVQIKGSGEVLVNIGIIGAGKVGVSLGKHFSDAGFLDVLSGFYSKSPPSAEEAARSTKTICYRSVKELVEKNEIIFITVPDSAIAEVWDQCKEFYLAGKIFCHCSGALSSAVFKGIESRGSHGFSIHPFMAVSDKYTAYQNFPKALFTIEGSSKKIDMMQELFKKSGIKTQVIEKESKLLYHCSGALASNCMIGLTQIAIEQLIMCGFSEENARIALMPLMIGNLSKALESGTVCALTGPVERADAATVISHLNVLSSDEREVYRLLSKKITEIAEIKNPGRDYDKVRQILES